MVHGICSHVLCDEICWSSLSSTTEYGIASEEQPSPPSEESPATGRSPETEVRRLVGCQFDFLDLSCQIVLTQHFTPGR